jgi:hypothetical protein
MDKFLIEVPHDAEKAACARAIRTFLRTGSHFLANADWGCSDGEHKAWLILELPSREDALTVVPPTYRAEARVVKLDRYTLREVEESLRHHD